MDYVFSPKEKKWTQIHTSNIWSSTDALNALRMPVKNLRALRELGGSSTLTQCGHNSPELAPSWAKFKNSYFVSARSNAGTPRGD